MQYAEIDGASAIGGQHFFQSGGHVGIGIAADKEDTFLHGIFLERLFGRSEYKRLTDDTFHRRLQQLVGGGGRQLTVLLEREHGGEAAISGGAFRFQRVEPEHQVVIGEIAADIAFANGEGLGAQIHQLAQKFHRFGIINALPFDNG